MRRALALLFLSLSIEAASAQGSPRDPGRDDALNAAIAVSAGVDFMFRRLSLCSELDTRNSATYIFIAAEYLRDATIHDTIDKTEHLMDTEVRSLGGNPAKAKAIRQQEIEKLYQKRRQQAFAALALFQQDCRQLAQYFLLRQGPFRPLRTIYPKQMSDIDIWYTWESVERCFTDGICKR